MRHGIEQGRISQLNQKLNHKFNQRLNQRLNSGLAKGLFAGIFCLLSFLSISESLAISATGNNGEKISDKIALVYRGPGACEELCSEAAALMAQKAGLTPRFVGPKDDNPANFDDAVIWLQPGGMSTTATRAMTEKLKGLIRQFVYNGGGYVGFCAGGFLATKAIGASKRWPGLGIFPGSSISYENVPDPENGAYIIPLNWMGKSHMIYWEGGPYFEFEKGEDVDVIATYPDGLINAARANFGKGRVFVTGSHPEAPEEWRNLAKIADPDGLDYELAVDQVKWAAQIQ